MKATSVIIMTHLEGGRPKLPHVEDLLTSNPDLEVHVCIGRENGRSKYHQWKNSDRELRHWWQQNAERVSGDVILVIEWDTLIQVPIPSLPPGRSLAGAKVMREDLENRSRKSYRLMNDPRWTRPAWLWFRESTRLGLGRFPCVGLVSFGFMLMKRSSLDAISESRFDAVFEKSIQNELRFPSLVSYCGGIVGELDLPGVQFDEVAHDGTPGIWHSIKGREFSLAQTLQKR
jgi:hypothetical protein